ncbi:MAG: extracellular solute-binding protein, partial [Treponema sp.]|nr:extracellular solute-binding protein [Treponema sp.]
MKRFSGISELTIAFALVFAVLAGTPIFARGTRAAGNGDGFIHVKVGYGTGPATGKFYGGETLEKNAWSDLYEKAGIKLDILFSDAPNYNEKLTQSIMAGDYPDVFYTRGGISQFKDFVEQGVIREIGTLFDQYGNANLKRFYSGEIQSMGLRSSTFNGKLYSLPMSGDPASNVYILWVRKDWLDKLGLQPPRTALQFYDVAKAFTEQDPDGNG